MTKEFYLEQNLELLLTHAGEVPEEFAVNFRCNDCHKPMAVQLILWLLLLGDAKSPDINRPWRNQRSLTIDLGGEKYNYLTANYEEDSKTRCFEFDEQLIWLADNSSIYTGKVTGHAYADYFEMKDIRR